MQRSLVFLMVTLLFALLCTTTTLAATASDGGGSLEFRLAASPEDVRMCQALRHQVFVQEQKVPVETEMDGRDEEAFHVMCWEDGTTLIATGRCLLVESKSEAVDDDEAATSQRRRDDVVCEAVLGRIAVHATHRGRGIGRRLIAHLERHARHHDATRVTLTPHAHLHDFYARLGYRRIDDTGYIGVNEHCTLIQMEKWL